jgi:hypothetical protein
MNINDEATGVALVTLFEVILPVFFVAAIGFVLWCSYSLLRGLADAFSILL